MAIIAFNTDAANNHNNMWKVGNVVIQEVHHG